MRRLSLFSLALLAGCSYTNNPSGTDYDSLTYNAEISTEPVFDFMNDRLEPTFPGRTVDSTARASTDAKLVVSNDSRNHFFVLDRMRCRSWIDADTLWIDIFEADGFTSHGLTIRIRDGKFKCSPFYATDVIMPDQKAPDIYMETQQVTLDRQKFQVGDSLYGYVSMRAIVNGREKKYASGYFRTRIEERYNER